MTGAPVPLLGFRSGSHLAACGLALLALVPPGRAQDPTTYRAQDLPGNVPNNLPDGNFRGSRTFDRPLIFFPPIPPQLGASINLLGESQGRFPAPPELASYVGEPFYAPLSTRLARHRLRANVQVRLAAYRDARLALLAELRGKLDALQNADAFTRERELVAFAKVQTPRVAALEKTADDLRADLVAGGFFEESADWDDQRQWHLGVAGFSTPTQAMLAQYQVMRAGVFYLRGLSPAQRRLLHEVAMELAEVAGRLMESGDDGPPPAASADTNPLFFFSPETARIRLPTELSPELARRISDYEREKSALKGELREKVYAEDRASFDFLRTRAFAELADRQEPRIAALESLAEEIRRGLAMIPGYAQPPSLPRVPPAVIAGMLDLVHAKRAAQKSAVVLVREIKSVISVSRVDATRGPEGRAKLSVMVNPQDRTEAKLKPVREMVTRYNAENATRIAAMEQEKTAMQEELTEFVRARDRDGDNVDTAKAVKDLMDDAYGSIERREEWALYRDYRAAVLEPGLSPEQRRLLYSAGLEALELPLPAADRPVGSR
jgi:hypothetical protein